MKCPVYRENCPVHGFVHGAEAEELRNGIEKLVASLEDWGITRPLQLLLDRVDARDSLAFREAHK